jgi:hypothetical protein
MQQYSTIRAVTESLWRPFRAAIVLAVLAASFACSKGDPDPPVATVSVALSRTKLPLGSPVDLTYRFDVAPSASIAGDYRVFLHVKSADGQILWTDDHMPPVPTSQWKGGQKIEYTRTRFVPVVPYLGEAMLEAGLYRENEPRLPLQGSDPADRESTDRAYKVGTLQLLPTSDSVFIIYKTGWHPDEFSPDDPSLSWKWTQKAGTFSVRNPKTDVTLFLEYDARPDVFPDKPQQVTLYAGDQPIKTFAAEATAPTLLRIPVSGAQLGTGEMTDFKVEVDRTFVPAKLPAGGKDVRELGVRVYHAFVETH